MLMNNSNAGSYVYWYTILQTCIMCNVKCTVKCSVKCTVRCTVGCTVVKCTVVALRCTVDVLRCTAVRYCSDSVQRGCALVKYAREMHWSAL